jgi:hypothetical protein
VKDFMTDDDPRRPNLFDGAVIRRQFERLLARLIDRLGTGSGSWSR